LPFALFLQRTFSFGKRRPFPRSGKRAAKKGPLFASQKAGALIRSFCCDVHFAAHFATRRRRPFLHEQKEGSKMHQTSPAGDAESCPNPQLDLARFLLCRFPDAECFPRFISSPFFLIT